MVRVLAPLTACAIVFNDLVAVVIGSTPAQHYIIDI